MDDLNDTTANIKDVSRELRAWGGVAVVGAGLSVFAGMPLGSGLSALVWQAIDSDQDALNALAKQLGVAVTSAKHMIGDDTDRLRLAYELIRTYPKCRASFQNGFRLRNDERAALPSTAHEALARLFHEHSIELVVSLNWDTLFEASYQRLYGRLLRPDDNLFFKPHGDAANSDQQWVLPDEAGTIPESLLARLTRYAAEKPRLLIIVGYSESDEEIVRKLIEPLSNHWRVCRIGPDVQSDFSIRLSAHDAMPLLNSKLQRHERPHWTPVLFQDQHGLGPALAGEGLGPQDIVALPALPEEEAVVTRLEIAHNATISGPSGSGKSGTAYRAAKRMSDKGWEVMRFAGSLPDFEEAAKSLDGLRFPTVAIIDDAHRFPLAVVDNLVSRSGPRLVVLAISTSDQPRRQDEVRVDSKRAISLIVKFLQSHRAETLEIVHRLDNHVGDSYGSEPFERRLEEAGKAETAWQFSFILTGGWRRVGQHVLNAKAAHRADLLLLVIAVFQLARRDSPASTDDLDAAAKIFGFDRNWTESALKHLEQLRLITSASAPKCQHLRYGNVAIQKVLNDRQDRLRSKIISFLDSVFANPTVEMQGLAWLIDALRFTDGLWGDRKQVLTVETRKSLLARCFSVKTTSERNSAAFALSQLDDFFPDWGESLRGYVPHIAEWISSVDGHCGWGLARFLNDIDRNHHAIVIEALKLVDAAALAKRIGDSDVETLAGLAEFLDRFAYVGRDGFAKQVYQNIERAKLESLAYRAAGFDTFIFAHFVNAIQHLDGAFAIDLVERNADKVAAAFFAKPLDTFDVLDDVFWFTLSFDPGLNIVGPPSARQRTIAKRLFSRVDSNGCAAAIENGHLRDLERSARLLSVIKRADIRLAKKIIAAISLENVDAWLKPFWPKPPVDHEHFVLMLSLKPSYEPSRSWVNAHVDDLQFIPPRFAFIAPNAVAKALRRGAQLAYSGSFGPDWLIIAGCLYFLAQTDKQAASESIGTQIQAIARSLTTHQVNLYEDSDKFLDAIEEIRPGISKAVFEAIDPEAAAKHWPQLKRGSKKQRRALKRLLELASQSATPLSEVARDIRKHRVHLENKTP